MACAYKPFCTYLTTKMHRVGIHLNSIDTKCDGENLCEAVYENTRILTQHVDSNNAEIIAAFVKELFQDNVPIDTTETTIDRMLHSAAFRCPELHIDIYQPCTAKSCAFWTPNHWTRNCILCYRVDQSRDMLDIKELAFLLDKSVADVRVETGKAIAEARMCALADRLEKEEKDPTDEEAPPVEATAVPPTELEIIRASFHLSPKKVLKVACATFATLKSAAQALNMPPDKFKLLCDRFELSTGHMG